MSNTARAGSSIECFFLTFSFIWQSRNWTPSCITRLTSEPYLVSVEALRIVYLGFAVAITRLTSKPYLVYVEALPVVY